MKQEELKALLADMSLEEKIGQMFQLMSIFFEGEIESVLTGPAADLGISEHQIALTGSILGTMGAEQIKKIQKNYMEKQPHHIPMLFMLDVIHGLKTIFPAPIGLGATWNPEMVQADAEVIAKEAAVSGLHVTFSPMVDLVRDARWGRVMEATGEDPYLNSLFARAMVKGFQGESMGDPYHIAACVKHFAAYGAATAGRDYNTVEMSENTFRNYYLPSYAAGIDAGAGLVMTSFNTLNNIPASMNQWLMRKVLREELGFDGVLISDFSAIMECIAHGYAADQKDAAKKALEAGVDIDMMTGAYARQLKELVKEKQVEERLVDEAVFRILQLKNKLGLFENPFKDADPVAEKEVILCEKHRKMARKTAEESFVLLKNDGILPLDLSKKTAFIGPYTNNKNLLSSWAFTGDASDTVSVQMAAEKVFDMFRTTYTPGCPVLGNDVKLVGFGNFSEGEGGEKSDEELAKMMEDALSAAREAEQVVLLIGEHYLQSGEATSRGELDIPEIQKELFRQVLAVNKNVAVVLFNGRPLDLREISSKSRAVLEVWLPGTEGGSAIVNTLIGVSNPAGKLPMSFPYSVGQVPVHYNEFSTGRPYAANVNDRFRSKYLDIPNTPLYPFGYGLSYTTFAFSEVSLDTDSLTADSAIDASVTVTNTGSNAGTETVQLYIQDVTASVVRPVKELKGFRKLTLKPGETQTVTFQITEPMLRFWRGDNTFGSEAGEFRLWIGNCSSVDKFIPFRKY